MSDIMNNGQKKQKKKPVVRKVSPQPPPRRVAGKEIILAFNQEAKAKEISLTETINAVGLIGEIVLPSPFSVWLKIGRGVAKNNPEAGAWINGITWGVFLFNKLNDKR